VTASPPTHLRETLHRVSAIDALRGLAALLVLFYHARGMFWVGFSQTWQRYHFHPDFNALLGYLSVPLSYGSLGVTLFFVLSGYCIHRRGAGQLARDPRAGIDYRAFAVRRFWRIYPTYVAALLITALVDAWILSRTGVRDPLQDDSLHAFLVSLVTMQGYLAVYFGSNGVFWTFAMEVHLYLAYPILYLLSQRIGPRRTLLFTLAIGLAYVATDAVFHIEQHLPYRFSRGRSVSTLPRPRPGAPPISVKWRGAD
jgi:peptidoglycan/LPS O-acetylase OafA/YrhL